MVGGLTLYQHQLDGAKWLALKALLLGRAYLGDVPGLGKTRTLLKLLADLGLTNPLVVSPAIVRTHWARENVVVRGNYPAIVKSYDEIVRGGYPLMKDLIQREGIDALVLDEAHYLKSLTSKRSKILLGKDGYARRLPYVFAASGTPVPKNPLEFWTILSTLFPEVALEHGLDTRTEFMERFCVTRGGMVRGAWREKVLAVVNNNEEFQEILGKVMLRRTLDDVGLDVPAIDWQTVRLDSGTNEDPLNEFGTRQAFHFIAAGAATPEMLEEIARDPETSRVRRRLGALKVDPVVTMLTQQLENSDEKVVVFAHHRDVLRGIWEQLGKQFAFGYVDGDTSPKMRDTAIDRFQNDPECRLFIGQNIACQTGITLTAARRAILVEPDWTKDVNYQLAKRIARIGQRAGHVVVQMIALAGTLDEAIIGQNLQEARMADRIGLGEE